MSDYRYILDPVAVAQLENLASETCPCVLCRAHRQGREIRHRVAAYRGEKLEGYNFEVSGGLSKIYAANVFAMEFAGVDQAESAGTSSSYAQGQPAAPFFSVEGYAYMQIVLAHAKAGVELLERGMKAVERKLKEEGGGKTGGH